MHCFKFFAMPKTKLAYYVFLLVSVTLLCLYGFYEDLVLPELTVKHVNPDGHQPDCPKCQLSWQEMATKFADKIPAVNGSCSPEASWRGPGQRVVSFTLYSTGKGGNNSRFRDYLRGVEANAASMATFYPGYVMRLYHGFHKDDQALTQLCDVYCQYKDVLDLCNVNFLVFSKEGLLKSAHGTLWRFAPMVDPHVDLWHSRDLDSRFSHREAGAVREFTDSYEATYHFMRDHIWHKQSILAGMFGMKNKAMLEGNRKMLFSKLIHNGADEEGVKKSIDQTLLQKYMWPMARYDMVAHDSYYCNVYPGRVVRPFPSERHLNESRNYVGSNGRPDFDIRPENKPAFVACPRACRPDDHQDWKWC